MTTWMISLIIIVLVGLAGIIGNQYSSLKRMGELQRSLDQINQKLREMKSRDGL